jgi:hypothetical protein
MFRMTACCLAAALAAMSADNVAKAADKMLSHDVYFSLNDNSPAAKEKLVAACKKYLSDHPGTVWFAAGPIAEELKRDVNDRDFDVALHIVFKSKDAHDKYSKADKHMKFIEETKANWKKVRVFDSYVEASAHGAVEGMPGSATDTGTPAATKERKRRIRQ